MRREVLGAAVAILMAVSLAAGYLYGVDSTPRATTTLSTTTTSIQGAYNQVQVVRSFANHMLYLSERNATAIASQYAENATVTWLGVMGAGGLGGVYNGTQIPVLLRASFICNDTSETSFTISDVNSFIAGYSSGSVTVYSTLDMAGQGFHVVAIPGLEWSAFNATVSAQDSFVYSASSGAWMISNETWIFTSFNTTPIG
jgi:hypothetical protein